MKRFTILVVLLLLAVFPAPGTVADGEKGIIGLDSVGYLQIQSPNEGARVYLDRIFIGFIQNGICTVPIDVTATPRYTNLIMEYTGYRTFIGPVPEIVPGKTVGVHVELNPAGYDRFGIIRFESGLPGTVLLLNGEEKGITPDSGSLMIQTIPGGLYTFTVVRPGNETVVSEQYVASNAITTYRVQLPPALTGSVTINTTPEGSGVYIENRYEGVSPLIIPGVQAGNLSVRVVREGFQDWTGNLTVTGGVGNPLDVVLVSLPPTPLPDCPPVTAAPLPFAGTGGDGQMSLPPQFLLMAGFIALAGLVACIAIALWLIQKKEE